MDVRTTRTHVALGLRDSSEQNLSLAPFTGVFIARRAPKSTNWAIRGIKFGKAEWENATQLRPLSLSDSNESLKFPIDSR